MMNRKIYSKIIFLRGYREQTSDKQWNSKFPPVCYWLFTQYSVFFLFFPRQLLKIVHFNRFQYINHDLSLESFEYLPTVYICFLALAFPPRPTHRLPTPRPAHPLRPGIHLLRSSKGWTFCIVDVFPNTYRMVAERISIRSVRGAVWRIVGSCGSVESAALSWGLAGVAVAVRGAWLRWRGRAATGHSRNRKLGMIARRRKWRQIRARTDVGNEREDKKRVHRLGSSKNAEMHRSLCQFLSRFFSFSLAFLFIFACKFQTLAFFN